MNTPMLCLVALPRLVVPLWLLLLPFALPASAQSRKQRALLVGIDTYQQRDVPRTPGGTNDARRAARLLQEKYGFTPDEILILTDKEAMHDRILQEFRRWLIDGTDPGARVYFHYSGHGSRLPDKNGDEKEDGYDETLAPYDATTEGQNHILDDDLNALVAQLSNRMAVLVFDSCHSGTISRGGKKTKESTNAPPRYLPSPEEFQQLRRQSSAARGSHPTLDYEVTEEAGARNLGIKRLIKKDKVGPAPGVVVLSAAEAGQIAYPIKVGNEYYGAFSYQLEQAQRANPSLPLEQLLQKVRGEMQGLQKGNKLKGAQTPTFDVLSKIELRDKPLFGDYLVQPQVALANPKSTIALEIQTSDGRSVYKDRDRVSYRVKTNRSGYLYLFVFSKENKVSCIYPNKVEHDNQIAVGTTLAPQAERGAQVTAPFGKDVVIAVLLPSKLTLPPVDADEYWEWEQIFALMPDPRFKNYVTSRGQKMTEANATTRIEDWQAASIVVTSIEK